MDDIQKLNELHASYLCLKDSVNDDLLSCTELKHALHYAGFNPSSDILKRIWIDGETKAISFNEFCSFTKKMAKIERSEIRNIISNVFIVNSDAIPVNDLKNLLLMSKRKMSISEDDIDALVSVVGEQNGTIKVSNLCKVISDTIKDLKDFALQEYEEKTYEQRVNSRTFTKKQIAPKMHNFGTNNSIDVKDWFSSTLKGSLFIDEELIISHQYSLEIACMGPTVIKVMPLKFRSTVLTVNVLAFIFRESADGGRNYIGYTNTRCEDGSNYWMDTLKEGKYVIIPYTTGCIKKKVKEGEVLQLLNMEDGIELTADCKRLLEDVFYQMDLDSNNLLNRQEFNLYNWRTSGEVVQDDEWAVVLNNFDVENEEVTLNGFLSLHQLEAEDNGGDAEDLWLSLETIGYNRYGYQERCCPISLSVYCQVVSPILLVSGLKSGGILLDKAVILSVMEEAVCSAICGRRDLFKFELVKPERGSIIIQNRSNEKVIVCIDCSESVNCFSNRESLVWRGEVDGKSAIIAHHLSPITSSKEWSVVCKENIEEPE